jgi:hypothetical protein
METSEEINVLKTEADAIKAELDGIITRIQELEKDSGE